MMAKKLAWLAVTALQLTSLADLVRPAWDERVMVPIYSSWLPPSWLYLLVIAGTAVVSALALWDGRRRKRPIMKFVLIEVMMVAIMSAALAGLLWIRSNPIVMFDHYEEHVIHHPRVPCRHWEPECGEAK